MAPRGLGAGIVNGLSQVNSGISIEKHQDWNQNKGGRNAPLFLIFLPVGQADLVMGRRYKSRWTRSTEKMSGKAVTPEFF